MICTSQGLAANKTAPSRGVLYESVQAPITNMTDGRLKLQGPLSPVLEARIPDPGVGRAGSS